jgi:hypothetical protein
MNASIGRFFRFLLLLVLLHGPVLADLAPFRVPEGETLGPVPSAVSWPSWPVLAGTGMSLCGAVMLAVWITRKLRRTLDAPLRRQE